MAAKNQAETVVTTIRLPVIVLDRVRESAKENRRTLSAEIRVAIERYHAEKEVAA